MHNLPKSIDYIARTYSPELKNVILYLLSKPGQRKSIEEALAMMGSRVLEELNGSLLCVPDHRFFFLPPAILTLCNANRTEDNLEAELMKELENGRIVRLLTKFGFINERPE